MTRVSAAARAALVVARHALESRDAAYGMPDAIVFQLDTAGLLRVPAAPMPEALTEEQLAQHWAEGAELLVDLVADGSQTDLGKRVAAWFEVSAPAVFGDVDRLRALVASMHAASVGCERVPLLGWVEDVSLTRTAYLAQQLRADKLDVIARRVQARVTELETERHSTNEALAAAHVRLAELETAQAGLAFPWVQWLHPDDQAAFLDELGAASITYAETAHALGIVEERIAHWRKAALATRPAPVPLAAFISFLAEHVDAGVRLGQYMSQAAAMDHVHHVIAREENTTAEAIELRVIWRADDPEAADPVWECYLVDDDTGDDVTTGYTVGPVVVAAAYDPDGDE